MRETLSLPTYTDVLAKQYPSQVNTNKTQITHLFYKYSYIYLHNIKFFIHYTIFL